jgi:hypothetical protein
MSRLKVSPRTFPATKEAEDWLRSTLFKLTGKCWDLSYTNSEGQSQSGVLYASCGGVEIAYCGGEPREHDLLLTRLARN